MSFADVVSDQRVVCARAPMPKMCLVCAVAGARWVVYRIEVKMMSGASN